MGERVLITILFFMFVVPFGLLMFFAVKKKLSKWYYKGLCLATGCYTNKRIHDTTTGCQYIQYNNRISCWLYTYVFPSIYKALIVAVLLLLLCVRIPDTSGYILRCSDVLEAETVAVFTTDDFTVLKGKVTYDQNTNAYYLDGNKIEGFILGEYIPKDITVYTIPGIVVRSVSASAHVFINKCTKLIEKIY